MTISEADATVAPAVEWQLIEFEVLPPHGQDALLGWFDAAGKWKSEVAPASFGWRTDAVRNISHHGQATHWQPIPEPPR